jgi:hypothetical protein
VLSPFWDDEVPAPAIEAVRRCLTGRPASLRKITLVVAVDPFTGTVQSPPSLALQGRAEVLAFEPPDEELRSLHAKLLLIETDDWLAALIGSSNATGAGFGLDPHSGHHELNLWLGCPARSPAAKHLRSLVRAGEEIELNEDRWEPMPDEDEPTAPVLPLGFVTCNIDARKPAHALLDFDPKALPVSWRVLTPAGREILTAEQWRAGGSPRHDAVELPDETLPAYLLVQWDVDDDRFAATWTANVEDRSALPPPADLAQLPVEVLLAALASSRPLPVALEQELRRRQRTGADSYRAELDPLRRFDDSRMLLQRTRQLSLALWRLQDRLGRPAGSLDALHWRLHGAFGPLAITEGLVRAAEAEQTIPGEAHFLLAELALTVAAVDWASVTTGLDSMAAKGLIADVFAAIETRRAALPPAPDPALDSYAREALEEARR